MPTFVASKVIECSFAYANAGNRFSSQLAWGCAGDVDEDRLQDLRAKLFGFFIPIWQLAVSQDIHAQHLYLRCLQKEQCNPSTLPFITVGGLIAEDSLPSNIAVVLKRIQTIHASRHNGRIFFAGVTVGQVTDGFLTPAAETGVWKDVADYLQNPITGTSDTYTPCIVERTDLGAPVTPIGLSVGQTLVVPELATQRRRTTELREGHA